MRRRLFNVAAAVSLVLCVATVALWVRASQWTDEWIRRTWDPFTDETSNSEIAIGDGRLIVQNSTAAQPHRLIVGPDSIDWKHTSERAGPIFWAGQTNWVRLDSGHGNKGRFFRFQVKFWLLVAVTSVLPV